MILYFAFALNVASITFTLHTVSSHHWQLSATSNLALFFNVIALLIIWPAVSRRLRQ